MNKKFLKLFLLTGVMTSSVMATIDKDLQIQNQGLRQEFGQQLSMQQREVDKLKQQLNQFDQLIQQQSNQLNDPFFMWEKVHTKFEADIKEIHQELKSIDLIDIINRSYYSDAIDHKHEKLKDLCYNVAETQGEVRFSRVFNLQPFELSSSGRNAPDEYKRKFFDFIFRYFSFEKIELVINTFFLLDKISADAPPCVAHDKRFEFNNIDLLIDAFGGFLEEDMYDNMYNDKFVDKIIKKYNYFFYKLTLDECRNSDERSRIRSEKELKELFTKIKEKIKKMMPYNQPEQVKRCDKLLTLIDDLDSKLGPEHKVIKIKTQDNQNLEEKTLVQSDEIDSLKQQLKQKEQLINDQNQQLNDLFFMWKKVHTKLGDNVKKIQQQLKAKGFDIEDEFFEKVFSLKINKYKDSYKDDRQELFNLIFQYSSLEEIDLTIKTFFLLDKIFFDYLSKWLNHMNGRNSYMKEEYALGFSNIDLLNSCFYCNFPEEVTADTDVDAIIEKFSYIFNKFTLNECRNLDVSNRIKSEKALIETFSEIKGELQSTIDEAKNEQIVEKAGTLLKFINGLDLNIKLRPQKTKYEVLKNKMNQTRNQNTAKIHGIFERVGQDFKTLNKSIEENLEHKALQ